MDQTEKHTGLQGWLESLPQNWLVRLLLWLIPKQDAALDQDPKAYAASLAHRGTDDAPLPSSKRFQSIDALRGLSVFLMVWYHFFFDLVTYAGAPRWLFHNPVFDFLLYVFSGLFILLAGVSSRLSRSNLRRGAVVLIAAIIFTDITIWIDQLWALGALDVFGILHLLGCCMLFYGLTRKLWDRLPDFIAPILYIVLIVVTAHFFFEKSTTIPWLYPFGLITSNFVSSDYYPLLPWIFVFLLGSWLGKLLTEGRLPKLIYTAKIPFFPTVGRYAFIVYLIHQPLLYFLTQLIKAALGT